MTKNVDYKIRTTINKKEIQLANMVIKLDSHYSQSGLRGYVMMIVDHLKQGNLNNLVNPGAEHEEKYMHIMNEHADSQNMNLRFDIDPALSIQLTLDETTAKWLTDLDQQLMQQSFWNLSRIVDYAIIQILENTDSFFNVPIDDATFDVLDDMRSEWELQHMVQN